MVPRWLTDSPEVDWLVSADGFSAASAGDRRTTEIDYDVEHVELGGVVWLDDVEEERLEWLWLGYIPRSDFRAAARHATLNPS